MRTNVRDRFLKIKRSQQIQISEKYCSLVNVWFIFSCG